MAKAEPESVPTPQEAADMERRLNLFRADQARQAAQDMRDKGKPVIDFAGSDEFKKVEQAMADFEPLIAELTAVWPNARVFIDAVRNGLVGFRQFADSIPPEVPAGEQIVEG